MAEEVTVTENAGPLVSTDPAANASATVISGKDLEALSDDPEDLQADLEALAGPSAGPSGGAIFVHGFSGGQLPPKESIREIRINSNPFSPEYDKLGYGRIEIFTKPGSDKFHGSTGYNLGTDRWNSRNPYAATKAPFLLQESENTFSGPLGRRASFTLDAEYQAVDNGSVSNAVILDAALRPVSFSSVLKTPQRHILVGPHVDYRLNDSNTLTLRYLYTHAEIHDAGIGSFDLISRGSNVLTVFQTGQVGETSIHGPLVNETRFQFFRRSFATDANQLAPEVQVLGSFNSGGATTPHGIDNQNNYEFQNYTSVVRGTHFFRFGVRLREQTEYSVSTANFNGTFTFTSLDAYRQALQSGTGASQFSISAGTPALSVRQFDASPFFGDDWKIRPQLTLSLGVRYETQTNMRDRGDVAPRIAVAWAPGGSARRGGKTVLRGGVGLFYDRFPLSNTLLASRFNGIVQQQYVVANPDFFGTLPPVSALAGLNGIQTVERTDPNLRAPYIVQSAVTVERQLPKNSTAAFTYTNSFGQRLFRSEVLTGSANPVFLMTSNGRYNQNQLIANINSKVNPAVSLFGYYVFNRARSDTDGFGTFPANPRDFAGEYGPAASDVRHRVLIGGTVSLRWNIRLNPLLTAQTGSPFNITTGEDTYGTTLFNARPVVDGRMLTRNSGRGPGSVLFNLKFSKTWGFGPEKGGGAAGASATPTGFGVPQGNRGLFSQASGSRKYNVIAAMSGRNLLNHNNPGPIVGNIKSPLFGRANQIAGTPNGEGFLETASNRRLELQLRFTW